LYQYFIWEINSRQKFSNLGKQSMDFGDLGQAISQGIGQLFDQVGRTADRIADTLLNMGLQIGGAVVLALVVIMLIRSFRRRPSITSRQKRKP
jgi:hypothetical protein